MSDETLVPLNDPIYAKEDLGFFESENEDIVRERLEQLAPDGCIGKRRQALAISQPDKQNVVRKAFEKLVCSFNANDSVQQAFINVEVELQKLRGEGGQGYVFKGQVEDIISMLAHAGQGWSDPIYQMMLLLRSEPGKQFVAEVGKLQQEAAKQALVEYNEKHKDVLAGFPGATLVPLPKHE